MVRPYVVVDEDFNQIFKPFHYAQMFYCMQPFNIKKNHGTPITKFNIIPAVLINILIVAMFYATVRNTDFWDESAKLIYIWTYSQYVHCFMLVTFLNFYQRKMNFMFLEELQEIHRNIRSTEDTKRLKTMSWYSCGSIVMYYLVLVLLKLKTDKYWHWTRGMFLMTTTLFEIKLANVSVTLYFLILKLRKWQRMVFGNLVMERGEIYENWDDLKLVFQKIVSVFSLFKKTFQIIVLFHFVMTFLQSLIYIDILVLSSKTAPDDPDSVVNHVMGVVSWIIKGVTIEVHFCVICEIFYTEIEYTRGEIIRRTGSLGDIEEIRRNKSRNRFGKCITRIIDTNFSQMMACGLFTVDVALPIRLAGLVATYTLVLIQFVFKNDPYAISKL